jgi:antitoxin ParD1/3/4
MRNLEIARLKRAYDEGMASGQGRQIDPETFLSKMKSETAARG